MGMRDECVQRVQIHTFFLFLLLLHLHESIIRNVLLLVISFFNDSIKQDDEIHIYL